MTHIQLEPLYLLQNYYLQEVRALSARPLFTQIDWSERLIGVIGAKGVGKTTLILKQLESDLRDSLYISLDHPLLMGVSLFDLAKQFQGEGGKTLYIDEIHKYENWSEHLKAIYDAFKNLKVVFSGSSALHLTKGKGDLSRRASMYRLPVLSFREFLQIENNKTFPVLKFSELLTHHAKIATGIVDQVKPLKYFKQYLQFGAYPFYREGRARFLPKLQQVVNLTVESDLVLINNLEGRYVRKLKQLLAVIANAVPYTPNMVELAGALEMSRPLLYKYLEYLEDAQLISLLRAVGRSNAKLTKAEKIYLENTNLVFALGQEQVEKGTLRETFVLNQLRNAGYVAEHSKRGDFMVDGKITLEVGGNSKKTKQIAGLSDAYLVIDDLEVGIGNRIPLWLFGLLY